VFALLRPNGEVHVLDTHFYPDNELETSVKRSQSYYSSLSFSDMARYYFHHSLNQIQAFNHQVLFDPNNIWNRLNKKDAFYWIMLKP
jgi:hypothetical protein